MPNTPDGASQTALDHRSGGAAVPFAAGGPASSRSSPTKPMATQRDLSLAYSPGVAVPVQGDRRRPDAAYDYTVQGQLGRGHHQRHRDPRPRQPRRAGRQAGDGRQGGAVQALRRRRLRSTSRSPPRTPTNSSTCVKLSRPVASAASISRTSRRRSASSSRSACAS